MERKHIAALLEKFWAGETSLEEEKELRLYFLQDDVPQEWKKEAAYFRFLDMQLMAQSPSDEEILASIESNEKEVYPRNNQIFLTIGNLGKVAAVVVIVALATFFLKQDYEEKREKIDPLVEGTIEDPQKAFEETKKALMLVSQQLNKGKKHAQKLGAFEDAQQKVKKLEREL